MCGIVGYVGEKRAAPILLDGLQKLEYRGYDSAGIAVFDGGILRVVKKKGRVKELEPARALKGNCGIGHTRWATHGAPSEANAHPHTYKKFTLVHNGIIENAHILREECLARGEKFSSETDSEVIAHLISDCYAGNFAAAVCKAAKRLQGSFALAVLFADAPDTIVCARRHSPLVVGKVVGKEKGGLFVASDVPAIAADGVEIFSLGDGEFAELHAGEIQFFDENLRPVSPHPVEYSSKDDAPALGGYRHFMRKEMSEIPAVLAKNSADVLRNAEFSEFRSALLGAERIQIVACGTAYHAGLCAAHAFEKICRVPCEVSIASEYRYRDPIVPPHTVCFAVSQSGETADTLAAAQIAKEKGAYLAAVTNVAYSSLTRISDAVLLTNAGREVAVAATKSFNAQLMLLYGVAAFLATKKGREVPPLAEISKAAKVALEVSEEVRGWTAHFLSAKSVFFLGRGADYFTALEGSLKLKEITYLPSEGYPAGELKHGTLALIEKNTPVVAVVTQRELAEKTMNAVHEVYARGAKIFLVTCFEELCARKEVFASVLIPACPEEFSPAVAVIPLQALAYYLSLARGNDPDKPRNLAKSVTVE